MVKIKAGVVIPAVSGGLILTLLIVNSLSWNSTDLGLVPVPRVLRNRPGNFHLTSMTRIVLDSFSDSAGELLAQRLRKSTGFKIPLGSPHDTNIGQSTILLTRDGCPPGLGPEGYDLEVTTKKVILRAPDSAGLFYGTQTLLQLLPPEIFSPQAIAHYDWRIPCVRIEDEPRFIWRGAMLDVSRHFFSVEEIKRFLDEMALHKLNTFHWHLTDDQGWRIEIKKWPLLTVIGAWRKKIGFNLDPKLATAYGKDGRYGGYYTQAEIQDIVAYAEARHINVVPEIDLPGHSSAALAAYPQFSCTGGPYTTDMAEAVHPGVYCAGKEETFQFLESVLDEVLKLFPGPFIHVGGDEVPRQNWCNCPLCQARIEQEDLKSERYLEGYFIKRIEKVVNARGKRLIGWSEIHDEYLAPGTVLMDWIGGGPEAARAGHDAVMSPEEFCYLDFYQSHDRTTEPAAAGAYLPLRKAYSFEPVPVDLPPAAQAHILGAQGNLWTEYIPSRVQLEYMAFPRLCALSEVFWSPKVSRNWEDFSRRLTIHKQRLDYLDIHYRGSRSPASRSQKSS